MKHFFLLTAMFLWGLAARSVSPAWLEVSRDGRWIVTHDGRPFFWLADTGWLLPERLDRDEAETYLADMEEKEFNVCQVQVQNTLPAYNAYGQPSCTPDLRWSATTGTYGYWEHLDYIIDCAARHGIYISMVCVWGSNVKSGRMDTAAARRYGEFLAGRYKDKSNIVWMLGGDVMGDIHTEVWDTLAAAIRRTDRRHLITFHPRGRHTSAEWLADRDWIDFHTFQSGHRRYGQGMGQPSDSLEEDNWRYVERTSQLCPGKPVLDSEPSYENIPQGLHDDAQPRWTAADVRRYAYWSLLAGACGHTYGNNEIMQFVRPGVRGAYFADGTKKAWWNALDDPGRTQMRYLKRLMLSLPWHTLRPDESLITDNGTRYDRIAAARGDGFLLAYSYNAKPFTMQLPEGTWNIEWMDAQTGERTQLGQMKGLARIVPPKDSADGVAVALCKLKIKN